MPVGQTNRRAFIAALGGAAAWPLVARAQQPVRRIAYLTPSNLNPAFVKAFKDALRDLGWVEGRNVAIELRFAEDKPERLPELASELVALKPDVIAAAGTLAPLAAKRATSTIPIVMIASGDPLGTGLAASLARPGGNVTGLSLMVPDIGGKRLELLKELLPQISQVAVLWDAANPYPENVFRETQIAARVLGITIQSLEVKGPDDFNYAFELAKRQRPDTLIAVEDPLTITHRHRIVDFAANSQLPAIYGLREFVEVGGLMAYGANLLDLMRRSAEYIDKILRGGKPADMPIQQPTKFALVINLKTAKALGTNMPPTLLARADEVIE
jgi:putative ABC transport system substrate-binding protein